MEIDTNTENFGNYIVAEKRLVKLKDGFSKNEKEKNDLIKKIAERCVPKKYAEVLKREGTQDSSQTEDFSKSKRICLETRYAAEINVSEPQPTPSLNEAIRILANDSELVNIGSQLTQDGANLIGGYVDIATAIVKVDYDLTCPLLRPTPSTDRMFWGRKMTKPKKTIDANSKEIVSHERFHEGITLRDHWLVVEGVQPCVPENTIPAEVRRKFQEQQHEHQRLYGFGQPGMKRDTLPEKRLSTQTFSIEHQVLYSEMTKKLACGSALERQKVLECIETDPGLQFLVGRFVILIAEGVRLHIGTRNIRGLANLLKLTWSLMKNRNIRLDKYLYVLIPSLISCVVSKNMVPLVDTSKLSTLAAKATVQASQSEIQNEDKERIIRDLETEFRLRETAGRLLVELSEQYQSQNVNVRIIQTLRKVLSGIHDPVAIYGVLCTFFAYGILTVQTVVLPKLHDIFCSLQNSRVEMFPAKTTMTKMRKIIVETNAMRMEVVQNRTIELIMKIIYENEIYNERKVVDRDEYMTSYSEFGALFYDYALISRMVHENTGHLKVTRPSLLQNRKEFFSELEKMKKPKKTTTAPSYHNNSQLMNDESMLDNILDDSDRPWTKAASQVEESDPSPLKYDKATFFRKPKLFLVQKMKHPEKGWSASHIRPIEYGFMPTMPSARISRRTVDIRETMVRESAIGQSFYASRASELLKTKEEAVELFKKFVKRPDDRSGAIIYGRNLLMSRKGKDSLSNEIAKAALQLSNVRLKDAVVYDASVIHKDEMSRGKFLARPQTLIGS
ncbi:unnamed protein product [Caenorhabditis sp. 36 PRJEB53466]|nr:unnamed protein product [Caenorhabditis sp. 36 PRJEB53466]